MTEQEYLELRTSRPDLMFPELLELTSYEVGLIARMKPERMIVIRSAWLLSGVWERPFNGVALNSPRLKYGPPFTS